MRLKFSHTAIILVFFILIFMLSFILYSEQAKYQGASLIHAADNQLSVVIGDQLLKYTDEGIPSSEDFTKAGINTLIGGISYFPNGDLLLRAQSEPTSLLDEIKIFFRWSGDKTFIHQDAKLLRCSNLDNHQSCTELPIKETFTRTYRSHVLDNGQIFIADTANHRILWYDVDGSIIDEINQHLKFPNKIIVHRNQLIIANTNYHELTIVPLLDEETKGFSEFDDWHHISLDFEEAIVRGHIWPTEFTLIDGQFLILSQGTQLAGGSLFLVSNEGTLLNEFIVSPEQDLISLDLFNEQIYVSDFSNYSIHIFDKNGNLQTELNDTNWLKAVTLQKENKNYYQNYQYIVMATGIFVFFILFIVGIIEDRKNKIKKEQRKTELKKSLPEQTSKPTINDKDILWLPKTKSIEKGLKYLPYIIGALLVFVWTNIITLILEAENIKATFILLSLMIFITIILVASVLLVRSTLQSRLGIKGQWIILEDRRRDVAIAEINTIKYTISALIIDKVIVNIGNKHKPLFNPELLAKHIEPYLNEDNKMSPIEYFKYLWAIKDPQARVYIPIAILLFICMLTFEIYIQ